MGRMQVLGLGLVLMLTWIGWASPARVDPRKTLGRWYHIFTASNELEEFSGNDYMRLYSPYFDCIGRNCDDILLKFLYRYQGNCYYVTKVMYKQGTNLYKTLGVPSSSLQPVHILEVLDVSERVLLLGYIYESSTRNAYAILALGREHTLSEQYMEKFQKVLQQKGIVKEPVRFTGNDVCTNNRVIKK